MLDEECGEVGVIFPLVVAIYARLWSWPPRETADEAGEATGEVQRGREETSAVDIVQGLTQAGIVGEVVVDLSRGYDGVLRGGMRGGLHPCVLSRKNDKLGGRKGMACAFYVKSDNVRFDQGYVLLKSAI